MPKKWTEVVSSPEYQALDPDQREQARSQYFNEVVAPQVPKDQLDAARSQFDTEFGPGGTHTAPVEEKSTIGELGRQAGLTLRHTVAGVTALPAMVSDALTGVYNTGADLVQGKGKGFRFYPSGQSVQKAMTDAGLPAPKNATERVVGDVSSAMVGAGASMKAGQFLASMENPVTAAVGEKLAAGSGMQTLSAATGGGAAGVTRENGGGAGAQFAAGLLGSLLPSVGPASLAEIARRSLRGGEAGRQRVANNVRLFEDAAGTMPSLAQATEGRAARAVESAMAKTPGGAGVISKFAARQADDMKAAVQKASDDLAPEASSVNAGEAIVRGVDAFKKGFKETQSQLYQELGKVLPNDTAIKVDRTKQVLQTLNEDIEGAPELSKWFKNSRVQGIEQALQLDLKGPSPGVTRVVEPVAGRVDPVGTDLMGQPVYRGAQIGVQSQPGATVARAGPTRTDAMGRQVPIETGAEVTVPGQQVPVFAEVPMRTDAMGGQVPVAPVIGERTTVIQPGKTGPFSGVGVAPEVGTTLPYEAIRKLRTLVGNEITDGGLTADVPRSKWQALYAALSDDLGDAAKAAGPKAAEAWEKANDYTRQHMQRLDELSSIVKQKSPERVFNAAMSGTAEGDTMIRRVMNALPADEKKEVAAAVLQRLGRATPGQQNAMGDVFSSETFLTNLSKLSPAARKAIFGSVDGKTDQMVANLAKLAESRRDGGKVFQNPSGTASSVAQLGTAGGIGAGAAMAAGSGNLAPLAIAAAPLIGSNVVARAITSPNLVKYIAKETSVHPSAPGAAVQAAGRMSSAADIPPEKRVVGAVYETPRGRMVWLGNGWGPEK